MSLCHHSVILPCQFISQVEMISCEMRCLIFFNFLDFNCYEIGTDLTKYETGLKKEKWDRFYMVDHLPCHISYLINQIVILGDIYPFPSFYPHLSIDQILKYGKEIFQPTISKYISSLSSSTFSSYNNDLYSSHLFPYHLKLISTISNHLPSTKWEINISWEVMRDEMVYNPFTT